MKPWKGRLFYKPGSLKIFLEIAIFYEIKFDKEEQIMYFEICFWVV